jgi:SAM-dependent methyltransferase
VSDDYHDYVIRKGELVGAFEEMYQSCDDPWMQDQVEPLAQDLLLLLYHRAEFDVDRLLDIGCGKGRLTNRLASVVDGGVVGLDVSPTALATASERSESVDYLATEVPPFPFASDSVDVVVAAELLWYVLDDLSSLFVEIDRVLTDDGRCFLIQQYYDPDEQSYGNETMERPADLLPYIPMTLEDDVRVQEGTGYKWVAHFRSEHE